MLLNLEVPKHPVDVVLDTDAYNEIDDQFAIAYLIRNSHKLHIKAIYAAPFYNCKSESAEDGMEKSFNEILKILDLMNEKINVFKGSTEFLPDENTYVDSEAARNLVQLAHNYSPENPLYVIAIGAITNIASALIMERGISENIVVVWLGGHALHYHNTREFNMVQDIAAARVVMGCDAPIVQLPCMGVVSEFRISGPELRLWLMDKNPISNYLARNAICEAEQYAKVKTWTRIIWDVTAVAWLLNDNEQFMKTRNIKTRLPKYDGQYSEEEQEKIMKYVYSIDRDALINDMIDKLNQ